MRLIDADALLNRMQKDPLFDLVERYGVSGVINAEPTVDAVPADFIESEIARMKEDANRYYSECEAYAEDLDILLMEWERRKNETD